MCESVFGLFILSPWFICLSSCQHLTILICDNVISFTLFFKNVLAIQAFFRSYVYFQIDLSKNKTPQLRF